MGEDGRTGQREKPAHSAVADDTRADPMGSDLVWSLRNGPESSQGDRHFIISTSESHLSRECNLDRVVPCDQGHAT